jgi:hypothetical protein
MFGAVGQAEALGTEVGPAGLPLGVVLLAWIASATHGAQRL